MKISELAKKTGVPPKTIRFYGSVCLNARTPADILWIWDYGRDSAERLRFIRAAQSVGLALGEVREVLDLRDRGQQPCVHVTELISMHPRDLDDRIAALESMRRDLNRLEREAKRSPHGESTFCHILEVARPPA